MAKARQTVRSTRPSQPHADPTSSAIFLRFLQRHKARFEQHLRRKLAKAQARYPRMGAPTLATTEAVIELCERGGKRVRPGLVLAGAMAVAASRPTAVLFDAAVALELLHAYFLVHDDWMDGDLTRRGGPSVHALLRQRFGGQHIGDAAAILAGDWGVAVTTQWMANLRLAGPRLQNALNCFAEMQLAAVVGQIRDLLADDEDAELTYRLKTASYTVAGPLLLGAIIAGANSAQCKVIEDFALPIGVAFQLRDDLIGVFAPPEVTGKPFASDIREGKRTPLVLEAFCRVSATQSRWMRRILGNRNASDTELVRFVRLLESSGAQAAVEARIKTLHRRGIAKLNRANLRSEGKALLVSAASALIDRNA